MYYRIVYYCANWRLVMLWWVSLLGGLLSRSLVQAQAGGGGIPNEPFFADTTHCTTFDGKVWLFSLSYQARNSMQPIIGSRIQPRLLATLQNTYTNQQQIWNFERKSRIRHYDRTAPLSGRPTNRSPLAFVVQTSVKILQNTFYPARAQPVLPNMQPAIGRLRSWWSR